MFGGCVGHLLSLTAGGEDSMHVWGRGGPPHTPLRGLISCDHVLHDWPGGECFAPLSLYQRECPKFMLFSKLLYEFTWR